MASNHINSTAYGGDVLDSAKLALSSSASFKARKKPNVAAPPISRAGSDVDDIITLLHGSDPVRVELNRLENEVRGHFSLSFTSLFSFVYECWWKMVAVDMSLILYGGFFFLSFVSLGVNLVFSIWGLCFVLCFQI